MRDFFRRYVPVLAALHFLAATGQAAVVASTFGPNDTFDTSHGNAVSGPASFAGNFSVADPFVSPFSGTLTSIEVALTLVATNGQVSLYLYQDNATTGLPSTASSPLFLGNLTATSMDASTLFLTLEGTAAPTLAAGQKYWLAMIAATPDAYDSWNAALPGGGGSPSAYSKDGGKTFLAGTQIDAYRIDASPVPEPSAWVGLGVGAAGVSLMIVRRRRAIA